MPKIGSKTSQTLIWCGIETTGLSPDDPGATIFEVALLATDCRYVPLDKGVSRVFKTKTLPQGMDRAVHEMHKASGLLKAVLIPASMGASVTDFALNDYNRLSMTMLLSYMVKHANGFKGSIPICGSSPHFDKRWLDIKLPALGSWFNHRVFDASTFHQAALNAGLTVSKNFNPTHRAMEDILDSISLTQRCLHALTQEARKQ